MQLPWWCSGKDCALPLQGKWVWSLVCEPGSHRLHSVAKKKKTSLQKLPSSEPSVSRGLCNSNIKDQWPLITIPRITMKTFETWGLPTCDAETQREQMLLGKWHKTCPMQSCHKPSIFFFFKPIILEAKESKVCLDSQKTPTVSLPGGK